jgi:colanic acid biosynthesis protein WcaH
MDRPISIEEYENIREKVPLSCVDLVLVHEGKVLLFLRVNDPLKGEWWLPGGRILKGETLEEAAQRKARQEIGIEVTLLRQIGTYETFGKSSSRGREFAVHTVNVTFLAKPKEQNFQIQLDDQTEEYKWVDPNEYRELEYIQKVFRDAGLINKK